MTASEEFSFSENHNDVHELIPYGATMEDALPSFRSILGAGNDDVTGLTPSAQQKKISGINEFYNGLKAPYFGAQHIMRKSVSEKRYLLQSLAGKKEKKAVQLEIEELEDALIWSIKKLNVLEAERIALISKFE
jgi:hypothetical protein